MSEAVETPQRPRVRKKRVGFIGLGDIGKPMAMHLAANEGVELHVFDVAPDPVAALRDAGAVVAESVGRLVNSVDVVCVMVRTDEQVRSVLSEALADLRPRNDMMPVLFVVHSTISPETAVELEAMVNKVCGFAMLIVDAPVSGGAMGAGDGRLAIMAGCSDDAFHMVKPVLEIMGAKVIHTGPVGSGTKFKLARNLMHFVSFTAATEAQRLAEAAGLDLVALGDVVRYTDTITGGPGAIMHRNSAAPLDADDFWVGPFSHVRALGEKDLGLAIGLAEELGVDVPLAKLAYERLGPGLGLEEK